MGTIAAGTRRMPKLSIFATTPRCARRRASNSTGRGAQTARGGALLDDIDEFDVEIKRAVRRNGADASATVCRLRRTGELSLATDSQLLHALRPARDDSIERERSHVT